MQTQAPSPHEALQNNGWLGMNGRSTKRYATDLKSYSCISPDPGHEGLDQHGVDMALYSKFSQNCPPTELYRMPFLEQDFESESGNQEKCSDSMLKHI